MRRGLNNCAVALFLFGEVDGDTSCRCCAAEDARWLLLLPLPFLLKLLLLLDSGLDEALLLAAFARWTAILSLGGDEE